LLVNTATLREKHWHVFPSTVSLFPTNVSDSSLKNEVSCQLLNVATFCLVFSDERVREYQKVSEVAYQMNVSEVSDSASSIREREIAPPEKKIGGRGEEGGEGGKWGSREKRRSRRRGGVLAPAPLQRETKTKMRPGSSITSRRSI
jgi:hypothetical protein